MREIKFRAWIDADKKMYPVIQFQSNFSNEDFYRVFIQKEWIEGQPMNYRMTGKNALMQFTGWKDGKGEEIYEGDICRYQLETFDNEILTDGVGIVEYHEWAFFVDSYPITEATEIIGNIYENPELRELQEAQFKKE